MEEIELKEILEYYLKKTPVIILMTILVILVGYLYIEYYQIPMYHGKTTIILIQRDDTAINDLNKTENQLNVNEKLVATYSEIIKSRRVLEQVINKLSLKKTYDELEEKISIDSVSETSIIEITVSDKNNEQAAIIANEIASTFKEEIVKIYNLENVSIIDEAIIETKPYNINLVKQLVIYGIVGLAIACIFIFIIYYFDTTIKSKKEIETKLKLPVLGEVPLAEKLLKKENQKVLKNNKETQKAKENPRNQKTSKSKKIANDPDATKDKIKKTTKKKTNTSGKVSKSRKVNKEGSK